MNILILGGKSFLGRHIVDSFQKKGHEVTLFNRGKTNPELFPETENIQGDRYSDLHLLNGRKWDVVIDTSGYDPKNLEYVSSNLNTCVDHYIFVSSCSVYDQRPQTLITDESAKIVDLPSPTQDLDCFGKHYGACKYLSERAIERNFKGKITHIRAGLIVGPHDTTSRFTYWTKRLSLGGDTLAPPKDFPTKFIDARDLADWFVHLVTHSITGVFNACGPQNNTITIGEFLKEANQILGDNSVLHFATESFLEKNDVKCWTELPLWVYREIEAFLLFDSQKAIENGLSFRSIQETVENTAKWAESISLSSLKYETLSAEKEMALLQKML